MNPLAKYRLPKQKRNRYYIIKIPKPSFRSTLGSDIRYLKREEKFWTFTAISVILAFSVVYVGTDFFSYGSILPSQDFSSSSFTLGPWHIHHNYSGLVSVLTGIIEVYFSALWIYLGVSPNPALVRQIHFTVYTSLIFFVGGMAPIINSFQFEGGFTTLATYGFLFTSWIDFAWKIIGPLVAAELAGILLIYVARDYRKAHPTKVFKVARVFD